MSDIRQGDRVRVTFEGTANEPHASGDLLVQDGEYSAFVPSLAVEVIERAKPTFKVGDTVSGEGYDHLPKRAVVPEPRKKAAA